MNKPWTKDSTPLFSVLIANYNNGQYLEECLQSVFDQTYTNWEIILVDDGSTDEISHAIYQKYDNDPRIKVFKNEENRGCGYAKWRCAELASGEICGFLDPDDALASNALETMVDAHGICPNASLIYSQNYICDENLNILHINTKVGQIPTGSSFLIYYQHIISAFASFKTEKYRQTEKLCPFYKRAIDHDLYFKLEEIGATHFIPKPLYLYRNQPNSISLNKNRLKALYWDLQIKKDTFKRRKNTKIPNLKRKDLNQLEFNYFIAKAIEKSKKREFIKMYYCLSMASKHIFLDKNFSVIRIAISPLKNVIN